MIENGVAICPGRKLTPRQKVEHVPSGRVSDRGKNVVAAHPRLGFPGSAVGAAYARLYVSLSLHVKTQNAIIEGVDDRVDSPWVAEA